MKRKKPSKATRSKMNLDERFRQLRTNIEFSQFDQNLKVINIVSTFPNEGKSTVALNLAKTYGVQFSNVLLVDCDLRNPSVHKLMEISNAEGLSNLLTHYTDEDDIFAQPEVQKVDIDENHHFYVLTSGQRVPNPQELLASRRFRQLMDNARKQASIVIVDCPPCMAVSDAIPVCNAADGTLYVVSARGTDKAAAREGMTELKRNGANIIGAILTKAEEATHRHGYYYYYDYGYGYGDYGGYGYGYGSEEENQN